MENLNVLDQMQSELRYQNFSTTIEKAYIYWARAYLSFNEDTDPAELGLPHLEAFLHYLSVERYAPKQTVNQALHAILFLYKQVLNMDCKWLENYIDTRENAKAPNVLTPKECQRLLSYLFGQDWLIASLIYGSGLRLSECLRLRVRDINLGNRTILVRNADGDIQRITILPNKLSAPLENHLQDRRMLHIKDLADGFGKVFLPRKIAEKYPNSARSWGWQYIFTQGQRSLGNSNEDTPSRIPMNEKNVKTAVEHAALEAGVYKQANCNTLRNSFAVHLIQYGVDIKAVEALLGHGEANAFAAHLHTQSPLDKLLIH